MSDMDRIRALNRLFQAKLDKMPADMPYEDRIECAKKEMDKCLGPIWREEIKVAGVSPIDEDKKMDNFYDRVHKLTREEGYHGDDVPEGPKGEEEKRRRGKKSIIMNIIKFLHG